MADELLRNRTYANEMEPHHAKLWLWHAVEETEHKAVAFDVYLAVGGGYVRRAIVMQVMTTLFFFGSVQLFFIGIVGEYIGAIHTNSIEGFWSILKRGVVGTFHKISEKYLPLYVAEFQFRYNNRDNPDIFGTAIARR